MSRNASDFTGKTVESIDASDNKNIKFRLSDGTSVALQSDSPIRLVDGNQDNDNESDQD